jgi:hypothetical protein
MTAEEEKAPDLEHREKNTVASDDDVLDAADPLVLVIHDIAAYQLARAIAFRHGVHVDNDELDTLRQHGQRDRGNQHRRDERDRIAKAGGCDSP